MPDLGDYMADGVENKVHPLDKFVKKFVKSVINSFVVPWLASCLQKYSEADFHLRMQDTSFDFINDWETNHPKKYSSFISKAQKLKHNIDFNEEEVTNRVVGILNAQGWTVYSYERAKLFNTVLRVKGEIYGFRPRYP
jgi:hypothetical protein